jgi:hypothetical protein
MAAVGGAVVAVLLSHVFHQLSGGCDVVGGAYLVVRVGWYLDLGVSNENEMMKKKNIPTA